MTDEQRRAVIKQLIAKHTKKSTASRKVARDVLIKEGIYTKDGELRVEYGGVSRKSKSAA